MNTELLKSGLAEFGLNPSEWTIEISRRIGGVFKVRIRHLMHRDLTLTGWVDQHCWLDLSYQG